MPQVLPMTRVEAYLAYKAGVISEADLKPSLKTNFYSGLENWLAYWCGLTADYPKDENNDPKWYTEEEYYIAYLCGIAPDYPVNCYRRVGAYLRYIISARWEKPEKPLTREEYYLSLMSTTYLPPNEPASVISLSPTAEAPFGDLKIYGDSFQQTYTGKNLYFNRTYTTGETTTLSDITDNGFTAQTISSSASIYADAQLNGLTPGAVYTLNAKRTITGTGYSGTGDLRYFDGVNYSSYFTNEMTFVAPESGSIQILFYQWHNAGAESKTTTIQWSEIQLELGSSPTSFEPYVGGIPAPNPDYPQDINVVTGNQTVQITGKNFIDATKGANASNYTVTLGTIEGRNDLKGLPVYLKPNTAYTVSLDANGWDMTNGWLLWLTSATQQLAILQYKGTPSQGVPGAITDPVTFTTDDSGIVYLAEVFGGNPGRLNTYFATVKLQLEIGNQATAYQAYQGQSYTVRLGSLELVKIGAYQDYIWNDGGTWKKHKEVDKILLNGDASETWYLSAGPPARFRYENVPNIALQPYNASSAPVAYTKYFKGDNWYNLYENGITNIICSHNSVHRIAISAPQFTSVELFKTWLSSNNMTVYYAMDTATDETITDATLISQLDALLEGGSYDYQTNIVVSAADPNLPGLLQVTAAKWQ